jgi:hypothetical protein
LLALASAVIWALRQEAECEDESGGVGLEAAT